MAQKMSKQRTRLDNAAENVNQPTLIEQLQAQAKAHKGTDFGGLLGWAAVHIESLQEALAEREEELQSVMAAGKRMHDGLKAASAAVDALGGVLYAAYPIDPFATVPRDYSAHANVMAAGHQDPDYMPTNGALKPMMHVDARTKKTEKATAPKEYDYKTYAK